MNLINHNEGLKPFKTEIIHQLCQLPTYQKEINKDWVALKNKLKKIPNSPSIMSFQDFYNWIQRNFNNRFTDINEIKELLQYFHQLGLLLWYNDYLEINDWVVLKPDWATTAVYRILDDETIKSNNGIVNEEDFNRIWSDIEYEFHINFLKKLVQIFKIGFKKRNSEEYIVSYFLNSIKQEEKWKESNELIQLEYEFKFMPKGLINQITADLYTYIQNPNEVWNNAVNLYKEGVVAQIFEDAYQRIITVKIKNEGLNNFATNNLIAIINHSFKSITEEYKGVNFELKIPCPCIKCKEIRNNKNLKISTTIFEYDDLISRLNNAKPKIYCNNLDNFLEISKLITGVGLQENNRNNENNQTKNIKIFISYSKNDKEDLIRFKKELDGLKYSTNLEYWYDDKLLAGDKFDPEIENKIKECDIFIILVSVNSLSSEYIMKKELPLAIKENKKIIPLILTNCKNQWQNNNLIKDCNAIPNHGKPIEEYRKENIENKGWDEVSGALVTLLKENKNMEKTTPNNI